MIILFIHESSIELINNEESLKIQNLMKIKSSVKQNLLLQLYIDLEIARNAIKPFEISFPDCEIKGFSQIKDQEILEFVDQKIMWLELPQNLIQNF